MKNKKEQSVSSPRVPKDQGSPKQNLARPSLPKTRIAYAGAEDRYIPMESYLTKGKLSYIIPKKSKNSAVAFFDLDRKEPLVYDLKKWFSLARASGSALERPKEEATISFSWSQLRCKFFDSLIVPKAPVEMVTSGPAGKKKSQKGRVPLVSKSSSTSRAAEAPLIRQQAKGGRLELPFLFTSSLSSSGGKIKRLPRVVADHPKEGIRTATLPCAIN